MSALRFTWTTGVAFDGSVVMQDHERALVAATSTDPAVVSIWNVFVRPPPEMTVVLPLSPWQRIDSVFNFSVCGPPDAGTEK